MDEPARPIQTYSREAERIISEIVRDGGSSRLSALLTTAMQAQADEIADFFIERSKRHCLPRPDGGRA